MPITANGKNAQNYDQNCFVVSRIVNQCSINANNGNWESIMSKFAIVIASQWSSQRGKVKSGEERKRIVQEREVIGIVPMEVAKGREWPIADEASEDIFYQYRVIESADSVQDLSDMLNVRRQAAKIEALAGTNLSDEDLKGIVQDTGLLSLVLKRRLEKRAGKTAIIAQNDPDDRSDDADFLDDDDDQRDADAAHAAVHSPVESVQTDDVFA